MLEEVIVTAQKRSERLQEVPVPVTTVAAVTLADNEFAREHATTFDYSFPLRPFAGVLGTTVSYVGNRVGVFIADDTERQKFPAYTRLDTRAGVKSEQWAFDLYVNNVTDERGVLGGGTGTITPTAFQLIQPRTVGFAIARTFQ